MEDIQHTLVFFEWIGYIKELVPNWGFFGFILLIGLVIISFYIITECIKISNFLTRATLVVIWRAIKYFSAYFILMLLARMAERKLMTDADAHYDFMIQWFNNSVSSVLENIQHG
jgi:hypothetical protein